MYVFVYLTVNTRICIEMYKIGGEMYMFAFDMLFPWIKKMCDLS